MLAINFLLLKNSASPSSVTMIQITRVLKSDLYDLYTRNSVEKGDIQTNLLLLKSHHQKESQDTTKHTNDDEDDQTKSPIIKVIASFH